MLTLGDLCKKIKNGGKIQMSSMMNCAVKLRYEILPILIAGSSLCRDALLVCVIEKFSILIINEITPVENFSKP